MLVFPFSVTWLKRSLHAKAFNCVPGLEVKKGLFVTILLSGHKDAIQYNQCDYKIQTINGAVLISPKVSLFEMNGIG